MIKALVVNKTSKQIYVVEGLDKNQVISALANSLGETFYNGDDKEAVGKWNDFVSRYRYEKGGQGNLPLTDDVEILFSEIEESTHEALLKANECFSYLSDLADRSGMSDDEKVYKLISDTNMYFDTDDFKDKLEELIQESDD